MTIEKLQQAETYFKTACKLKDKARISPDNISIYIEAAENAHKAGELYEEVYHNSDKIGDYELKTFYNYYYYEENDSLGWYYYEKHDCEKARIHKLIAKEKISDALNVINNIPRNLPETDQKQLKSFHTSWTFYMKLLDVGLLSCDAREAWDNKQYIKSINSYRTQLPLINDLIKQAKYLGSSYERIMKGNYSTIHANISQAMAAKIKMDRSSSDSPIHETEAIRYLKLIFDAYKNVCVAREHNPEWQQYPTLIELHYNNLFNLLNDVKPKWKNIYIEFREEPEFLNIMRKVDLDEFMKIETKHNNDPTIKLWAMGSFFVLVFVLVAGVIFVFALSRVAWWKFVFAVFSVEAIILIVGAFSLRATCEISERGFLKLIKLALKYQFLIKKLNRLKSYHEE